MEVATGEIKAMSNLSRLPGGEYLETVNNAVQGYEPGSVVKPLSMMIALDDGVVRPNDVINGHNGVFRYPAGARVRPITDTHGSGVDDRHRGDEVLVTQRSTRDYPAGI